MVFALLAICRAYLPGHDSMAVETYDILCGNCRVAVGQDGNFAVCPRCGKRATIERAIESAKQSATEGLSNHMADAMEKTARRSPGITFKRGTRSLRKLDFVIDLKL